MIVGLIGYKGSGKSVVARRLSREHNFVRRPFAYPLKAMIAALGVPADILDGDDDAKSQPLKVLGGHTARFALQKLGTEWGRNIMGQSFWVDRWRDSLTGWADVVADDVRFPNEAQVIRDLGGVILRVDRPGITTSDGHASENPDAILHDHRVLNNSTIEDLRWKVDAFVATLPATKWEIHAS